MTEVRIQALEELEAELARVAGRERPSRGGAPRRALALGASVLVLLAGAYTVPPTRAAIDDLTSTFAGWVDGDDEAAPGRAVRPEDDAPDWLDEAHSRVIAEAEGVELYVSRVETEKRGTLLDFGLGDGVIVSDSIEGWRERFDKHAVVVLGTALMGPEDVLDDRGRSPLLGVTARSVERVEFRYAAGPPLVRDDVEGGFVLLVDAWRAPRELVVYDGARRELERVDVGEFDLRYLCDKDPVCP